jgi:hypothetical protein
MKSGCPGEVNFMMEITGYQVNEKIYESHRSVVYRAEQLAGERPVVLKTLREDYSRTVKPGQIVLLTTDGIFEAHNPAGEMFGKDRFKKIVRQNCGLEAESLRKALFQAVNEFRGAEPQEDDITLVILKFLY